MVGHDHVAHPREVEQPEIAARNSRYGLWLFGIYVVLYGAFVGINAFAPAWMEVNVFRGVNAAVWSGLGLIAVAMVLALIYAWLCRAQPLTDEAAR